MSDSPASSTPPAGEDKTIAMLAYLTPLLCGIGIIIAILMHNKNKTALGAYHLRQSLGLLIVSIAAGIVFMILGRIVGVVPGVGFILAMLLGLLNMAVGIGTLVLWIMGLIAALNSEKKPMPVLGAIFQDKLATLFT